MSVWIEWEGYGVEGNFVFMIAGWIEDTPVERTLLARALREIGVTQSPPNSHVLAETVEFQLSWYGFMDGEILPSECDEDGFTPEGDKVDAARACTFAVLEAQPALS